MYLIQVSKIIDFKYRGSKMVARLAVESVAVVVVKHGNDVEVRAVEAVDGESRMMQKMSK